MIDEPFRRRFAPLLRPLVPALARLGVSPNHVTVATFLLAVAGACLIANDRAIAGLSVWLVSRVGDGLDGVLARKTGRTSAFGGYLDITLDMAGYTAMVLGFAISHPQYWPAWISVLAGYVLVITTTLALSDAGRSVGRIISATDRTFQFSRALAEAGETSVMYTLWVLFPSQLPWLIWLWVAALLATTLQRTMFAARLLR